MMRSIIAYSRCLVLLLSIGGAHAFSLVAPPCSVSNANANGGVLCRPPHGTCLPPLAATRSRNTNDRVTAHDDDDFDSSSSSSSSSSSYSNNSTTTATTTTTTTLLQRPVVNTETVPNGVVPQPRVAVLLNRNARSVTDTTVRIAEDVFGADHVYASSTAEQAERAARNLLLNNNNKPLRMILVMGGDGTLTTCINTLVDASQCASVSDALAALPPIAYIPRGTGNGVGSVVACAPQLRGNRALRRVLVQLRDRQFDTPLDIVTLPLLQVRTPQQPNVLCFFAGVGFDSLLLNDFKIIKSTSPSILKSILGSVTGYCVALVVKTLPSAVVRRRHQIHVRVETNSSTTTDSVHWMDHRRGDVCLPIPSSNNNNNNSTVVFDGTAGILAASTVPFYGGGLKLFPFARTSPTHMHIRIGRIHPVRGFWNIPRIFAGTFRDRTVGHTGVLDLIATNNTELTVQVEGAVDRQPYPLQHSGESVGTVREFGLRVVAPGVKFVSLWPRPPLGAAMEGKDTR